MRRPRVTATGPVDEVAVEILGPFGEIVIAPDNSEETLLPLLEGAVALVVRGDGVANRHVIEAGQDLRVIARTGVGYDNVDVVAATERGIPVVYTPGANARAVAEAAMALMLALCKNITHWDRELKAGNWQSRHESRPRDMDGATLGIIGFGSIGRALAKLAAPFDMELLACDPHVSPESVRELHVGLVELDELMRRADFISLHAGLTDETRGMIDRRRLSLVKPGSYLVNLARGGLIESMDALYERMEEGRLAGVALDVFEPEPPDVGHPIFRLPNLLTSPHALGMTPGAMARIYRAMAGGVAAVLSGGRPEHVVNPEVLDDPSAG
jgi:phosphoglycerate dehydrogenase-like enzyme